MSASAILITGGLTGIGRATALAAAASGYSVVVSGRNSETGEALVNELHSLGAQAGFIREIALQAPDLVRKLILVGTGTRGADMSASRSREIFAGHYDPPEHLWLAVHFSPLSASRAAGLAFIDRKLRRHERDPEVSAQTVRAQLEAIGTYVAPAESVLDYLKAITQPVLVVQGSNDVIIPTVHSYVLQQNLPNAQLILYPDANHGRYPELFVGHATLFLDT